MKLTIPTIIILLSFSVTALSKEHSSSIKKDTSIIKENDNFENYTSTTSEHRNNKTTRNIDIILRFDNDLEGSQDKRSFFYRIDSKIINLTTFFGHRRNILNFQIGTGFTYEEMYGIFLISLKPRVLFNVNKSDSKVFLFTSTPFMFNFFHGDRTVYRINNMLVGPGIEFGLGTSIKTKGSSSILLSISFSKPFLFDKNDIRLEDVKYLGAEFGISF